MKIVHLGVGEAVDETLGNNCHLIESKTKLLLDCGYNAVSRILSYNNEPDFIDAIYISHLHADHYFGLAPLLLRWNGDGRKKRLTIISREENLPKIKQILDLGYFGVRYNYQISYLGVHSGDTLSLQELSLSFAPTIHPSPNLAIRIEAKGKTVCYSGDGMFTKETEKLYSGADLVIHETYYYSKQKAGHSYATALMQMAKRTKIQNLIFCHIERNERPKMMKMKFSKGVSIAMEGDRKKI